MLLISRYIASKIFYNALSSDIKMTYVVKVKDKMKGYDDKEIHKFMMLGSNYSNIKSVRITIPELNNLDMEVEERTKMELTR